MKIKLFFLTLLYSTLSWGQILTFDFVGLAGDEVSAVSNSNNLNISTSTIIRGAGLTASGNGDRFNATNWAVTSIANAVSGNKYMEFTITPNAGYQFDISSIVVNWQRSGTGNTAIALRSSIDGYSSNLDAVKNVIDNTSAQNFTYTFIQANSITAVTYRLYSYAKAVGGSGGPGDAAGNDIIVNGTVTPTGPQPEINLLGSAVSIVSGDATPSLTDFTDFGDVATFGGTLVREYTIQNTGTSVLNIGAITFSGLNASDFLVTNAPSGTVAAGSSTTFQVTFDPSADGLRNATISIVNNDSNENPYTFAIQGNGISVPVITSSLTASGIQSSPFSYTIIATNAPTSYGASGLPTGLTINSATGVITGTPTVSGVFNVTITATNALGTTTQTLVITLSVAGGTVFNPGELVFVGYDGQVNGVGNDDQYLIATLVDMLPGTSFSLVNSRFEAGAPANVRTNKWGGGGDDASLQPYEVKLTYNGTSSIPAGSVLVFTTNGSPIWFGSVSVIQGTTSAIRTSEFSGSLISPGTPNISSSGSDQMYLMQGSFTFDGSVTPNQANYFLSGTLLHGITNRAPWVPLTAACNGDSTGVNTRESRLPSALTCFNVENASANSDSAFYENDKEHGVATIRQIVLAISDVANNWTLSTGRYTLDATSSLTTRAGKTFLIGPSNPAGQWVGNVDTNWFNCANWEGLAVPNTTTNVAILPTSVRDAAVNYTAPFSDEYSDIAVCNNITISDKKLIVEANPLNLLNVYGNLTISGTGALDMDDSNPATADGTLHLYGNWTNTVGNTAFQEGNGTVHFDGTNPQIINNVSPQGTEIFYNVVMNNNFDTAVSNDLMATGNMMVNTGKSVVVAPNDFIQVNKQLINNGDFTVQNNGSFVQVDEVDTNTATGTNFKVNRITFVNNLDYVYWSSPVTDFAVINLPNNHRYYWSSTAINANTTQGDWLPAFGNMQKGQGYIARIANGSPSIQIATPLLFQGAKPFNGQFTFPISRGTTIGTDDCWNLLGNPYPSAIDADAFLSDNKTIEGSVRIWMHGTNPAPIGSPFYENFQYNYTEDDYIIYNGTATTIPAIFNGKIASGQGFFVRMLEAAETVNSSVSPNSTVVFKNAYRRAANASILNNTEFFRNSNIALSSPEKSRIWLDLIASNNKTTKTVIGYVPGATLAKDRLYDALIEVKSFKLYSLIDTKKQAIQGRPVPFDNNDQVPLGIFIQTPGNYTIAISAVDGLFADVSQNIFLEDKTTNTIHDLRLAPYQFSSALGEFNDRFVLRYTNETLSNPDFSADANSVFIVSNEGITVTSKTENIKEIEVYDVLGRKLYHNKNVEAQSHLINSIQKTNSGLILNITLENGNKVSKKTIY